MRWLKDDQGRKWRAERVGRTSGIVPVKSTDTAFPAPADIIRFNCESEDEQAREIQARAGLLEQFTESELKALLVAAPTIPKT